MLVPSRGWTCYLENVLDTAKFGLLGPFYGGQIVTKLVFHWRTNGTVQHEYGGVWTASDSASIDAWQSGSPIVQRSDRHGDGQPVYRSGTSAKSPFVQTLAVGRKVTDTPRYIVIRVLGDQAAVRADVMVTSFAVTDVKEGR